MTAKGFDSSTYNMTRRGIRGRRPTVLSGKAKGGNILVRLDVELHAAIVVECNRRGVSMNTFFVQLVMKELGIPEPAEQPEESDG